MQQILNTIALLPPFLIFLTIILVIVPTILTICLRYSVYQHLSQLNYLINKLLRGHQQEQYPAIINKLNQRIQENNASLEQINTGVIIDGVYSQEKYKFVGRNFNFFRTTRHFFRNYN